MEYPGSRFVKPWRKIVWGLFVLSFFIVSPLIISYTIGYRYDWQRGLIRETGAISVDILPKNAEVYINNQKIRDTMPIRLNTVTPNIYTLRIGADNYYEWQKEIEVKNKQTVYIKEIELIKKSKPELIAPGTYQNLSLSPNGTFLIYKKISGKNQTIILRNIQTAKETPLPLSTIPTSITINWAPQSNYFNITPENSPYDWVQIYSISNPLNPFRLPFDASEKIERLQWVEGTAAKLYFSTAQTIYTFEPNSHAHNELTKNVYIDWYVYQNELWALQSNTSTNQLHILKNVPNSPTIFQKLTGDDYSSTSSLTGWSILTINQESALIKHQNKSEAIIFSSTAQFKLDTTKFLISHYNNWWLLWNNWELWGYSGRENPALLNRSGEQLQQVIPLDKHNTLLLVWAKKSSIFFPYYLVNHDFINNPLTSVQADSPKKIIYFSTTLDGKEGLWKVTY